MKLGLVPIYLVGLVVDGSGCWLAIAMRLINATSRRYKCEAVAASYAVLVMIIFNHIIGTVMDLAFLVLKEIIQSLSQELETGCLKLAIVKFLGVQIFKGDHNILRLQQYTCLYLSKYGMIFLYKVTGTR